METTSIIRDTRHLDLLWETYSREKDDATREKLVLEYVNLVRFVISRMFSHLPARVSRDDVESAGIVGLINAIERFDPDRGFKFETYAVSRIRGAIIDELRKYDLMPRSARAKMREIQDAIQRLEGRLGRSPSEEEIAAELGMGLDDYYEVLKKVSPVRLYSLSDLGMGEGEDHRLEYEVASRTDNPSPGSQTENQEMRSLLLAAIQDLPRNERLMIALYYYEEMTMKEIAIVLKVSESRVSQIHTQAILKLRAAVERGMQ